MIGTFIDRSLPPSDRTELAPVEPDLLPGLSLTEAVDEAIDNLIAALDELKSARSHNELAKFKAAASRLASLANHVARTADRYRANELQQKE